MNGIASKTPCVNDRALGVPTSWEKTIEVLEYLGTVEDVPRVVAFAISVLAPNEPSENRENIRVSKIIGAGRSTVEGWRRATSGVGAPLRLVIAVAKHFDGPDDVARAYEQFSRVPQCELFPW